MNLQNYSKRTAYKQITHICSAYKVLMYNAADIQAVITPVQPVFGSI